MSVPSVRSEPADPLIWGSPALGRALEEARLAARSDRPVLLTGETGSGKGRIAREIHDCSARRLKPYVVLGAGEVGESLGLSEMFGRVRGAFTGADRDGIGMIERAHTGTLLIDDVDKMARGLQSALLQFLDSWTVRKLGSATEIRVDVRLLITTNRPLPELMRQDLFLRDLAWRLRGLRIHVPSLRERPEDLGPLVDHFAQLYARNFDKPVPRLSRGALDVLRKARWPGNVRQLAGTMENLVFRASESKPIGSEDVLKELAADDGALSPETHGRGGARMRRDEVIKALELAQWNSAAASENADVPLRTFRRWMKEFGLSSRNRKGRANGKHAPADGNQGGKSEMRPCAAGEGVAY